MSIGGHSPLGTLLIQRLDAALGNTVGQQSNISTGARADAVSQPQQSERNQRSDNTTTRHPQHSVEQASRHAQHGKQQQLRQDVSLNRQAAIESLLRHTSTAATKSAPTTLGKAAQTILQIIDRYPEIKQGLQGRHPLANNGDLRSLLHAALTQARTHTVSSPAQQTPQPPTPTTEQATANTQLARPAAAASSLLQQLDTTALAQSFMKGLQQTVQHSGMFYEAQLARFAFGQGALQTLAQQPQNQTTNAQQAHSSHKSGHTETQHTSPTTHSAPAATTDSSDSPHSLLIRQQLEVLANQQFQWRGEAWQNVPLDWLIQRKQQHEGSPNHKRTVSSQQWDSHLRLQLPLLGSIEIAVTLVDKQLSLRIVAPDGHDALQAHLPTLQGRLAALDFNLHTLTMQEDSASTPSASEQHDG